jgi:hypothetical protein
MFSGAGEVVNVFEDLDSGVISEGDVANVVRNIIHDDFDDVRVDSNTDLL